MITISTSKYLCNVHTNCKFILIAENFKYGMNERYTILVLNLGSKKGTHFWDQKGHFLSRNLIMRAPNFAAPRRCSAQ